MLSVHFCSLHVDRIEITNNILDKYFDKQKQVIIHSIDVIENNIHVPTITQNMNSVSGCMEKKLTVVYGCKLILIRNIDVGSGIVDGLYGTYVAHNDKILVLKTEKHGLIPIPKVKQ